MQQTRSGSVGLCRMKIFPIFKAKLGHWFHWEALEWVPIIVIIWPIAWYIKRKGQILFSSIPGLFCSFLSPGRCPASVSRRCWHEWGKQSLSAPAGGKEGPRVSRARPRRAVPGSREAAARAEKSERSVSISHVFNSEFTSGAKSLWLILTHLKLMSPLNCNSFQKLFAVDLAG